MQTENRWETRVLPCPIVSGRTDDRFKLLRKEKAEYATGTTNDVMFHKFSLFWGFLRISVLSKVKFIAAKKWKPQLQGRMREVTPGMHPPT